MKPTAHPFKVQRFFNPEQVTIEGDICFETDSSQIVAVIHGASPAEIEANARLFAAAPDMLEALEAIRDNWLQNPTGEAIRLRDLDLMLEAAIRKARGA